MRAHLVGPVVMMAAAAAGAAAVLTLDALAPVYGWLAALPATITGALPL